MSSVIDLEAQQVAQAAPRAGTFFPLTHVEVVTVRKESSLRSVSAGQDIKDEAQSVVPQVESMTSICSCCCTTRRLFCSVTGSGGSDVPAMNIDQSRTRDDINHTTSDRLTQAEAQIRACFLMVVET
jgi:hypothetical protein